MHVSYNSSIHGKPSVSIMMVVRFCHIAVLSIA